MGTSDSEGQAPSIETNTPDQENNVSNLFDFKIKRMGDEDLINECLMHLRFVEMGLLTPAHKTRATQLFTEATTRSSLEYIHNDFLVALKVLKLL